MREEDVHLELMKLQGQFALQAMRSLLLLNGGAVIALLSFASAHMIGGLVWPIGYFAFGAMFAAITPAFAYFFQMMENETASRWWPAGFFGVALAAAALSLLLFITGAISAASALSKAAAA